MTAISLGIIPTDARGTAITEDSQIVQTVLAIDVSFKFVGFVGGQFCAAFRADVDGFLILFVGVFVYGIILLKNLFWVPTARIIYKQKNKACDDKTNRKGLFQTNANRKLKRKERI